MSTRRRPQGFTLIELLVGLVLLSLIALGVYDALGTTVRTWERASTRTDEVARLRSVESFVRRHVSQAAFIVTGRGSRAAVAFTGDGDSVNFVSELPAYLGGGGLYDFTLAFESGGEAEQLVVRFRPARLNEDDEVQEHDTTVLLEQVEEGGFEYYGTPRGRSDPTWHDRWDDAERLPLLVAVQWQTPGGSPWPRLLIEPRADAVSARLGVSGAAEQPDDGEDETPANPAGLDVERVPGDDGDGMPEADRQ